MKYGLEEGVWIAIQGVLADFPQVDRAVLYGSRAKGCYRPSSDIDLALEGPEIDLSTLFLIATALDDLLLPYKIDLVGMHQIESPQLLAHIHRVGIEVYRRAHPIQKVKKVKNPPNTVFWRVFSTRGTNKIQSLSFSLFQRILAP